MKKLSLKLWPDDLANFNQLHLSIVLSMFKNSNFNSKMNSLKEMCRLIDVSKSVQNNPASVGEEELTAWLVEEKILSLAIEGNLDQAQYCDKLKTIVEFLANKINTDEINSLWQMQFNKPSTFVDNLYSLISIVTCKFNQQQLDQLLELIKNTWNDPNFKSHDKLVYLLRLIGQESKNSATHRKILNAIWTLKDQIIRSNDHTLNQLIYKEHLNVLNTDRVYSDEAKSIYIKHCFDLIDHQENKLSSLYALKHLFDILVSYKSKSWSSSKNLRDVLNEFIVPEIQSFCQFLIDYNKSRDQYENSIFSHEQIVDLQLDLLKFILKEGNVYLSLARAQEIWDSLISSKHEQNMEKCFKWFTECIVDLNMQTRNKMFQERIVKLDPIELTLDGYECYRLYFLYLNQSESKIQMTPSDSEKFQVEEPDLDLDYLWQLILNNKCNKIVHKSIQFLIQLSYSHLSASLKRDIYSQNFKFIQIIFEKIKNHKSDHTQLINLLECLQQFIQIVDKKEICHLKSHSSSIRTDKINLLVQFDDSNNDDDNLHHCDGHEDKKKCLEIKNLYSNDLLENLKLKISQMVNKSVNSIQLYHECQHLAQSFDKKTLCSLKIDESSLLTCKLVQLASVKSNECSTSLPSPSLFSNRLSLSSTSEIKKHHPNVILSSDQEFYDTLDRLMNHEDKSIAITARNILNLLPTNQQLVDVFDSIVLFDSNKNTLEQFFTPKSNGLIKIIYNLETLSIRVFNEENFRQKFAQKNGINFLIEILDFVLEKNADELGEQLIILLINLIDYVLLEQSEPLLKKSLVYINPNLIDLLLKTFVTKSKSTSFNTKISIKSINLVYNLISSNIDQIDGLIESTMFHTEILNVLIGSKCKHIRQNLANFLLRLSYLNDKVKYRLIILILNNARVPIWTNSTKHMRSSAQILISQSSEYFSLLSNLIDTMNNSLMSMDLVNGQNELNAEKLLKNQINWFGVFNMSSNLDQILLNGHFKITKAILKHCSTKIKDCYSSNLIDLLVKEFLFEPFFASITCTLTLDQQTLIDGYALLIELVNNSSVNFASIVSLLCQFNKENKICQWDYEPLVKIKPLEQKYVGLKNAGSTCYMNAVLQQLFMIPGMCEYIQLMNNSFCDDDSNNNKRLLFELESIFLHLRKTNREFYSPEKFWQSFRMRNTDNVINIHEQQDAFDFFISLTDQIDEYILKDLKKKPVFKSIFQGTYSNQFICQDCDHSYDRQEEFLALNLPVKTFSNLEQSMAQFVKDELLNGDNSYFCEKCNLKVNLKKNVKINLIDKIDYTI